MLSSTRKFLLGFVLSMSLLPIMVFASSEFKGTETVNINKANAATLAAYLKGVGPNKAEAIVKYRKSNGSFKSAADIKNVPGIGDETYKDVKSKISTSRGKSTAPKGYKLGETSGKSKTTKKKATTKKASTKKSTAKKSTSSKSTAAKKKTKSTESTSSKAKKASTAKKATSKKSTTKKTAAKKKPSSTKKTTAKKKVTKKKPAKKKTSTKKKTTTKKKKSS